MQDEDKVQGRMRGEQPEVKPDGIARRLVHVILIALMLSFAQTVLTLATVIQFVILLIHKRPNERLAEFGTDLGIWIAKAARYQTGASEVKPWPWTELD